MASKQTSYNNQALPLQTPAADLRACVTSLGEAVEKGTAEQTAPYDLAPVEFSLLRVCLERGECTATQLAEVLPVDAARISRIVTKLVDMDLLSRRRLRNDRRVVMLDLTEKGHELTSSLQQRVDAYDSLLMEGVSEEEVRVCVAITAKVLANYDALKQAR